MTFVTSQRGCVKKATHLPKRCCRYGRFGLGAGSQPLRGEILATRIDRMQKDGTRGAGGGPFPPVVPRLVTSIQRSPDVKLYEAISVSPLISPVHKARTLCFPSVSRPLPDKNFQPHIYVQRHSDLQRFVGISRSLIATSTSLLPLILRVSCAGDIDPKTTDS